MSDGRAPELSEEQYLPDDGVVISPHVEVFREGSATGYAFLKQPVELAGIVSLAMFNKNPRVKDSPVDAPRDPEVYLEGTAVKFRAALAAVAILNAEVVVVPDVGCGVFGNDPEVVGSILGRVLLEELPPCALQEVVLTARNEQFATAVRRAYMGGTSKDPGKAQGRRRLGLDNLRPSRARRSGPVRAQVPANGSVGPDNANESQCCIS